MRRRRSRPVPGGAPRARPPGRRIGLLGGSFNPAHEGHRHVSLLALKRLGLHEVWWLVSPQNPLKPRAGMAAFEERLAAARAKAAGDRQASGERYRAPPRQSATRSTRSPGSNGAFRGTGWSGSSARTTCRRSRRGGAGPRSSGRLPVAVIDRWPYSRYASVVKPAKRFARQRLAERRAPGLARSKPPAWMIIHGPLHSASATALRAAKRCAVAPKGRLEEHHSSTRINLLGPVAGNRARPALRPFTGPSPARLQTPRRRTSSPSTSTARPRSPTSWSSPAVGRSAMSARWRNGFSSSSRTTARRRLRRRAARTRTGC